MELVHHHLVNPRILAVTQRDIRNNFRGGGDNRGIAINRGITSHHADVFRAEYPAQGEEFLAY